jgi:hypothetical protein
MATWKCKACEEEVDSENSKCPHCGADQPKAIRNLGIGCLLVIAFIILIVSMSSNDTPKSSSSAGQSTSPQSTSIIQPTAPITTQEQNTPIDPSLRDTIINELLQFNKSNLSILENGNALVATHKIESSTPSRLWHEAKNLPLEKITKAPYSCIGELCKISGTVQQVAEMPPDTFDIPGKWWFVLMLANNRSSPFGFTNIELFFNGDSTLINPQSKVTFAGYFIGVHEGQNMLGGPIESMAFVTNSLQITSFPKRR